MNSYSLEAELESHISSTVLVHTVPKINFSDSQESSTLVRI